MIHNAAAPSHDKSTLPTFYFYMPSGEQVSYCAHAAMGAAFILHHKGNPKNQEIEFLTVQGGVKNKAFVSGNNVELGIQKNVQERHVSKGAVESLLGQIGLTMDDVDQCSEGVSGSGSVSGPSWPLLNSSVTRFKTLIPIQTLDLLHGASNPKDSDEFRDLCDSIDSTGVYLYTRVSHSDESNEYECRQFPRASGYPEDPATGIAASALACSLQNRGKGNAEGRFVMNQGTAMNKHSRCIVRIEDDMVFCSGTIEIDCEKDMFLDEV